MMETVIVFHDDSYSSRRARSPATHSPADDVSVLAQLMLFLRRRATPTSANYRDWTRFPHFSLFARSWVKKSAMSRLCRVLFFLFLARSLSGRLYLAPSDKLTVSDDYDRTPYPKESGQPFAYWEVKGTVNSTGRSYTAHVAVLSKALPSSFSYALPPGGELGLLQGFLQIYPRGAPQVAAMLPRHHSQRRLMTVSTPLMLVTSMWTLAAVSGTSSSTALQLK